MSLQADPTASRRVHAPAVRWAQAARALSPGGWLLAATGVAGCVLAFVGLATSSWWTDEMFTLFVVDHRGGEAEVMRRALTDTHPPTYYLLLHPWLRVFGDGEAALRSLSALLAVGAVVVFVRATRDVFTREGRAFAVAIAVTSPLWFYQSQNIRNYSLCFLLTAVMLALAIALRRRVRAGGRFPAGLLAGLALAGLLDATTHFYGLLGAGALLFALMVTLPSWPVRAALAGCGLAMLAVDGAYAHLLAARTHENWGHLWFRKDPGHLLQVVDDVWEAAVGWGARWAVGVLLAALALGAAWGRRAAVRDVHVPPQAPPGAPPDTGEGDWLTGVCAFVLVAVYLAGVAETLLFAPTLSDQNVLTAAPAAWVLAAALYDAALRRLDDRARLGVGVAVGAVMLAHGAAQARGRGLPRNEDWRDSAAYVAHAPGCAHAEVPVVQPDRFGPDTPFYRTLAQRDFFGRYVGAGWTRLQPHLRVAFAGPAADPALVAAMADRVRDPAACPVLAWGVHDLTTEQAQALTSDIAHLPGAPRDAVRLRTFPLFHFKQDRWVARPSAFVIERTTSASRP